ncbi:ATP-binding protein [Rhizobium ruizarguesonis]
MSVNPGDYVVLSVRENGTGMSADVLQRATEPFFTTKPSGQGTRLGPSMVHGLWRSPADGNHRIESRKGNVSDALPSAFQR